MEILTTATRIDTSFQQPKYFWNKKRTSPILFKLQSICSVFSLVPVKKQKSNTLSILLFAGQRNSSNGNKPDQSKTKSALNYLPPMASSFQHHPNQKSTSTIKCVANKKRIAQIAQWKWNSLLRFLGKQQQQKLFARPTEIGAQQPCYALFVMGQ